MSAKTDKTANIVDKLINLKILGKCFELRKQDVFQCEYLKHSCWIVGFKLLNQYI